MNAKQLNAFRAVMLSGSMVGAAKMLYVSQPAVTRLIRDLEESCGFALFERRNSRLFATPEGSAFYQEVKQHFIGLENLSQTASTIRMNKTGRLRIATMPALAHSIIPQVVSRFLDDRQQVALKLVTTSSVEVTRLIASQQHDLGIVMLPMAQREVRFGPCFRLSCRLIMQPDHHLAAKAVIEAKDLRDEPYVAIGEENTLTRFRIDAAFNNENVRPRTHVETSLFTSAQALVQEGQGVSIIDPFTAHIFQQQGGVSRPFMPDIPLYFGFIFPTHKQAASLAEEFIQTFLEQARAIVELEEVSPSEAEGNR